MLSYLGGGGDRDTYTGLACLDSLHAMPLVHESGEAGYKEDVAGNKAVSWPGLLLTIVAVPRLEP